MLLRWRLLRWSRKAEGHAAGEAEGDDLFSPGVEFGLSTMGENKDEGEFWVG